MRFVDFLKTTVLACAGAATVLGLLAIRAVALDGDTELLGFALGWWALATVVGVWLGRERDTLPAIGRLLGEARSTSTLPEHEKPGLVLVNRLWPLFALLLVSAALAWSLPQVPAIGAGFLLIWALYWRRQEAAVTAIEERDGVAFFVERTKPWKAMRLVRTPGFRRLRAAPSGEGLG